MRWKPSAEFFTNTIVEIGKIKKLFKTISCLCPGLTINLNDNGNKITYYSEAGLGDLVDDMVGDKELLDRRFSLTYSDDKNKLDLVLTYTSDYSLTVVPYVNTGLTESGPHITQFKTIITKVFNKFLRDKGWLKEKDENLTGDDIQEGMYLIFNITCPDVAYNAQVKSTVTKIDMRPFTNPLIDNLTVWLEQNEKDIKVIADKALNARKAREAAKRARDNVREPKEKKRQFLNMPSKLVDCWSKDREKCELFICEGDSAAGGLIEGRDAEFVAVFPVRGKIIAAYKNSIEKVFANAEVIGLIRAIGLELDQKTHTLIYDDKKLRYGKIFLAGDADPDGKSIKNLLIELFWSLCPELIINGHLYTTMPPLYRITTKDNKYIFLKDQAALEEYKANHVGQKYLVNRNKG